MKKKRKPDDILSYFYSQWVVLSIVTISGLIYNIGLLANPYFEGKLVGKLVDILNHQSTYGSMVKLVGMYVVVISIVQVARYIKRYSVRYFANTINKNMKNVLYANLIHKSKKELEKEGAGNLITKAISDVDDCVEGMRKFTTEVFDTGIALVGYIGLLFYYDWKLSILVMLFSPISYVLAEKMKGIVQQTREDFKKVSAKLSEDTMDLASNAMTYRIFGCVENRKKAYEKTLSEYEKAACKANIWVSALPPLYQVISMTGILFILYFGSRNVVSSTWDIAIFTTYISCYSKMAIKSSKAAKLFNAVHKAQVSWNRIQPFLKEVKEEKEIPLQHGKSLVVENVSFQYPNAFKVFSGLSFQAKPGEIIGITGPVACGKSTLGKLFLMEEDYEGSILYEDEELTNKNIVSYLGHDLELMNDTVENNILLGTNDDVPMYLKAVCLDKEVTEHTIIGRNGNNLSGGQAQRLALARTLCHKKPILVLDDPFSALDIHTEKMIFSNIKEMTKDCIVIFISHRLDLFTECDQVIWMHDGQTRSSTHEILMKEVPLYRELYNAQRIGKDNEHEKT